MSVGQSDPQLNLRYVPSLASDACRKIFVGGLSQSTSKQALHKHFVKYGAIEECIIMVDRD